MEEAKSEVTTREIKVGDVYWTAFRRYGLPDKHIIREILPNNRVIGTPTKSHFGGLTEFVHSYSEIILDKEVEGFGKEYPKYLRIDNTLFWFTEIFPVTTFEGDRLLGMRYKATYKCKEDGYRNSKNIDYDDPILIINSIEESEVDTKQHNYQDLIDEHEELLGQRVVISNRIRDIKEELFETRRNCKHQYSGDTFELSDDYNGGYDFVEIISTKTCIKCLHESREVISISSYYD